MSSLSATITTLQEVLGRIQANNSQAQEHRSNATLANAGAVAAFLLTRGSKKDSVKTVGSLAAIGGAVYGSNQNNKASQLELQNNQLIFAALGIVETEGLQNLRQKNDPPNTVCQFMEVVLRLGLRVDDSLKSHGHRITNRGILSKANQEVLLDATNVDIVQNKLRMNRVLTQIDRTKVFPDYAGEFLRDVASIDKSKLREQSIYTMILIWCLLIGGVLLAGVHPAASLLAVAGLLIWGVNHVWPVLSEVRKLRKAVAKLVSGLTSQAAVVTLKAT